LNTAFGLVLLFAVTALLCSGFTETLSNFMQLRARYLLTGLRAMLDQSEPAAQSIDGLAKGKDTKKTLFDEAKKPTATRAAADTVTEHLTGTDTSKGLDLTLALFNHPAIKALQSRRIGLFKVAGKVRNPQYLSGKIFGQALVDTLLPDAVLAPAAAGQGSVITTLQTAIARLPNGSVKTNLESLARRSGDDLAKFEGMLEKWYDDEMAMISGWYKRWSRVVLGIFGLVVAIAINIDALQVAHALYVDGPTQQAVVASANAGSLCQDAAVGQARDTCVKKELDQLKAAGVPIGYSDACDPTKDHWSACWTWSPTTSSLSWHDVVLKLLGWLITAFAVSFGAPFWFEALSKLGNLRNTGTKPASTA
jgi:hypothetical protein